MLEYPLWYIYFLTVFSLILSLTPSYPKDVSDGPLSTRIRQWAGGIAALSILIGMANLSWEYQNLTQYSRVGETDNPQTVQNKIDGLQQLSKESPMLAYYADLSLSKRADPTDAYIRPWAEEAALKALTYRPYSSAYQVGLLPLPTRQKRRRCAMDAGSAILLPLYDVFLRRQNTQPSGIRPPAAQTFVRLQRFHQCTETPNCQIM